MRELLGGKGANLAEMTRIGLPVPPGFTITTEVCTYYYDARRATRRRSRPRSRPASPTSKKIMGKKFGDADDPLLVSVRSGARDSMPGMMDTILNLGLNDETVAGPRRGHRQRALRLGLLPPLRPDVRRRRARRAEARGEDERAVRGASSRRLKKAKGVKFDTELTADDLKELVDRFKALVKERTGNDFPNDPWEQLWGAIGAVFGSLDERPRDRLPPQVQHPRPTGARPSTCRPWSSATPATPPAPASPSPATRPTARTSSTASSSSTPRARTSSPASARREPVGELKEQLAARSTPSS